MFSQMSLKAKLLSFAGLCSAILLCVGVSAMYSQSLLIANYDHVSQTNMPNLMFLQQMASGQKDVSIALESLFGKKSTDKEVKETEGEVAEAEQIYRAAYDEYSKVPFVEGESELVQPLDREWNEFIKMSARLIELSATGKEADWAARDKLAEGEFAKIRTRYRDALNALIKFQEKEAKKFAARATASAQTSQIAIVSAIIIGFALSLGIGYLIARGLSRSLENLAVRLASGATQVAGAANQIASSAEELSASTTEQASSLQETSSSLQEMTSMVDRTSDNATASKKIAEESQTDANSGKVVMEELIQAIRAIDDANGQIAGEIEQSNHELAEIVNIISEIGSKTKVINDIVFQTKLLSFNASVEAARAGEHGKGFAVVAEEVGNLAQMSGNAAKEIATLLENSVNRVESTVNSSKAKVGSLVERGKEKVDVGNGIAKRCNEVLEQIVNGSQEMTNMAGEIAHASLEQSKGIQEINRAVSQLDQATQQNASVSHQTASASGALSDQARQLQEAVNELLRTINGTHHQPAVFERRGGEKPVKATLSLTQKAMKKNAAKAEVSTRDFPHEDDQRFRDIA